jgi:Rha family phage regulatory protein
MTSKLVVSKKDKVYTESQLVADVFEKEHKHVLRDIRELETKCSKEFWESNFGLSNYKVRGKEIPCYNLTRDGFTMLAMGFTGEKAIQFKEMYISKFNEIERMLISRNLAKMEFPELTNSINELYDEAEFFRFSNELNMINKIVTGKTAKDIREENGLKKGTSIRPYLTEEQINDVLYLQRLDTGFVLAVPEYNERKKMLELYYRKKKKLIE